MDAPLTAKLHVELRIAKHKSVETAGRGKSRLTELVGLVFL